MRLLCTAPIREMWPTELDNLGATVTELGLDGVVADDSIPKWDGAMITSEAFKLIFQDRTTGMARLGALYQVLADLVTAGRIGWVHLCASGLDNPFFYPLMAAAHERGITLTHCPGVYGTPIAQYCLAHMLSVARLLPQHAAQQARGEYTSLVQRDTRNLAVGIVGAGGIGSELARMAKAVGMRTYGWRRRAQPAEHYDEVLAGAEGLERLLRASDFVVLCVPHTPATHHLLGAPQLAMMRADAWLINVSRGGVVDEEALIGALRAEGAAPAGAVLDVFAKEPLAPESELWRLPNVVLTAHDSWRTDEALKDNHRYFLDNVAHVKSGRTPSGIVVDEYVQPALDAKKLRPAS